MSVLRNCPNCGTANRVPAKYLANTGRCGSCKQPLPPANAPIEADPQIFQEIVAASPVPILVDFWASWCGPCRMAAPEVAALAKEKGGRAVVLQVDTDGHPAITRPVGG